MNGSLNGRAIIERIAPLRLPAGQYCCFGSSTMALLGIREAKDIDVLASPELCEVLKTQGWQEEMIEIGNPPKLTPMLRNPRHPYVDIFRTWDYEGFRRTPAEIIADAQEEEGVYFALLSDVIDWKEAYGRDKDKVDIELIRKHLSHMQRFVNR